MLSYFLELEYMLPICFVIDRIRYDETDILAYIEKFDEKVNLIFAIKRADSRRMLQLPNAHRCKMVSKCIPYTPHVFGNIVEYDSPFSVPRSDLPYLGIAYPIGERPSLSLIT